MAVQEAKYLCNHYCGPNPRSLLLLQHSEKHFDSVIRPFTWEYEELISHVNIKPFTEHNQEIYLEHDRQLKLLCPLCSIRSRIELKIIFPPWNTLQTQLSMKDALFVTILFFCENSNICSYVCVSVYVNIYTGIYVCLCVSNVGV